MSARPILCHFLAHFLWFFVKTARNRTTFAENCDFCHSEYVYSFLVQNFVRGATFNFRPILADFHEYTLNMASYHVIETVDSYFWN